MKNSKILSIILFTFLTSISISAQDNYVEKKLYRSGVYGQTFELTEISTSNGVMLFMELKDNKDTNKSNIRFYDKTLPTVYSINSGIITNAKEYSMTISAVKEFFDYTLKSVPLADLKEICDLSPSCELREYYVEAEDDGTKYIVIDYECSDLKQLFTIASEYNSRGRAYVLEKYGIY